MHGEETTPFVTEYEGEKYYFCSERCKMSYDRYLQNMMIWPRNFQPITDNETHKLVLPEK